MHRQSFAAQYQPLSTAHTGWGDVAVLPWDTDIFGFPVADYRGGDAGLVATMQPAFQNALASWASANGVELISCAAPADRFDWVSLLARLGFATVDFSLRVTSTRFAATTLPRTRMTVRAARPDEQTAITDIAHTAFRFGRYHADPRFPSHLADLRYQRWAENACSQSNGKDRVYVLDVEGTVRGFFHVVLVDDVADLRLGAVDHTLQGIAGFGLYVGTLRELQRCGAQQVLAKIPAANTAVMNLYAALGFRFSQPEVVFHWHRPGAPHLVPADQMFAASRRTAADDTP